MTPEDDRAPIRTRGDFHEALRAAFAALATASCREILLVDEDFADWPLNEPAVVDALTHWAQPHRRCTVLARSFDGVARRHPRWVDWRRSFSHVVQCRASDEAPAGSMPALLLAPGLLCVRLVDRVHHRGSASRSAADATLWRQSIDELLQRSDESFPATTLGL